MIQSAALSPDWSALNDEPVEPANLFVGMLAGATDGGEIEGILLLVGHAAPPALVGTPDQIAEQIAALRGRLPVAARGRFLVQRGRIDELIRVLQEAARQYDAAEAARKSRA